MRFAQFARLSLDMRPQALERLGRVGADEVPRTGEPARNAFPGDQLEKEFIRFIALAFDRIGSVLSMKLRQFM